MFWTVFKADALYSIGMGVLYGAVLGLFYWWRQVRQKKRLASSKRETVITCLHCPVCQDPIRYEPFAPMPRQQGGPNTKTLCIEAQEFCLVCSKATHAHATPVYPQHEMDRETRQ